jgi:hypothetical protein
LFYHLLLVSFHESPSTDKTHELFIYCWSPNVALGSKNASLKVVGTTGSDGIAEYTLLGGSLSSLDVSALPSLSFDDPVPVDVIPSAFLSLVNLGLIDVALHSSSSLSCVKPNALNYLAILGLVCLCCFGVCSLSSSLSSSYSLLSSPS